MKYLEAQKRLLNALGEAVEIMGFDDLLVDMHEVELGRDIVMNVKTDGILRVKLKSLLRASSSRDGGLELLQEVLGANIGNSHGIRPRLEEAFRDYQDEKCKLSQPIQPDLGNCVHEVSVLGIPLREKLHALASQHKQLEPKRLQEAIARAMRQAFPDGNPANMFPSVFDKGPIADWADLLSRSSKDPFELDEKFLNVFEEMLALSPSASTHPDPDVSSLMLMVLRPPHLPASADCHEYAFRAYFCPHEEASPDQWTRVDAKVTDCPIRAAAWSADLQPLLIKAIAAAFYQRQSAHAPLLLEIFLPNEFLNEDIGELIKMQRPTGEWDPLNQYYPIVLRSSERYQFFHEGQAKEFPNPLPLKWEQARRMAVAGAPTCSWWHDPTRASRNHSQKAEKEIEKQFDTLRVSSDYFALKRATNLPACPKLQQKWLGSMIWACPAVALWWRPKARSSQAERRESLRLSRGGNDQPFGSSQLSGQQPAHVDHFTHPHTSNPLKLFHSFAEAVFHGRRSKEHARAFGELVLLMDSEERWPPPIDSSPFTQRTSAQGEEVITAREEEILFSD